jgi:hypothetical protein
MCSRFQFVLAGLAGWLSQQQQDVIGYLVEENRVLRAQLRDRRLRLRMTNGVGWRRADIVSGVPR